MSEIIIASNILCWLGGFLIGLNVGGRATRRRIVRGLDRMMASEDVLVYVKKGL